MLKTIISTILAVSFFALGGIFENIYVTKTFNNFNTQLVILKEKTDNKIATKNDSDMVMFFWQKTKRSLHVVIPHTEIKEIDLWISEAITLIEQKNYSEASQKIFVLTTLCNQIPLNFKLRIENIL